MKFNQELITKARKGEIAILNDGSVEELKNVMRVIWPKDGNNWILESFDQFKYYFNGNLAEYWARANWTSLPAHSVKEFFVPDNPLTESKKVIAGNDSAELYTAEELQKNFIRQTCEGYDKKDRALINQADLKGWFEWLASLKIVKEHGFGIG